MSRRDDNEGQEKFVRRNAQDRCFKTLSTVGLYRGRTVQVLVKGLT